MVQYQGSWESIFSPSSCKHLASLSLAQHYWGVQTCRRNAKSQTVCFQGPKNDFGGTKQNFIHPWKHFRWPLLRRMCSMIVIVIFTQRHLNLDQTNENIMTICCVYITTQDKMIVIGRTPYTFVFSEQFRSERTAVPYWPKINVRRTSFPYVYYEPCRTFIYELCRTSSLTRYVYCTESNSTLRSRTMLIVFI